MIKKNARNSLKHYGKVYDKHLARTSVVAELDKNDEIKAPFAFKGHMDADLFIGWLEQILVPTLTNPSKSFLFIDNATHYRKRF